MTLSVAPPGLAQSQPDRPAVSAIVAQAGRTVSFDIAAQPLGQALMAFGRQSGIQIAVDTAAVAGRSTAGVSGSMTPEEGLRQLLAGTGLSYQFSSPNAVTVVSAAGAGVVQLDPVRVPGAASPPQAMIGNLPPVYAGGQVARGGQLGLLGNRDFMDTPFNQTSYTAKKIKDDQARTVRDALMDDPSVREIFSYGGLTGEYVSVRGFNVAPSDMGYGGLYGVLPYWSAAPEIAERIEVLKGPSAFLNGMPPAGSIGATINMVAKRAGNEPLTQLTTSYYSNSQFGGHIDVARRFGPDNRFGARFNGVLRGGETAVQWNNNRLGLGLLGLDFLGDRVRLSADIGYQDQKVNGLVPSLTVAAGLPIPAPPSASRTFAQPWNYADRKDLFGTLRGEFDVTDRVTLYAAFGARDNRTDSVGDLTPNVTNANGNFGSTPYRSIDYYTTQTAEGGLRASADTGPINHSINLNVTSLWQQAGGSGIIRGTAFASNIYNPVFVANQNLRDGNVTKTSDGNLLSLALADTLSIAGGRVQVTLGARQQYVQASRYAASGVSTSNYSASALSPSVGVIVKPLANLSVYGNYIEGLQQGTIVGPNFSNAGDVLPPYKSKQYEAGIKVDWGKFATTVSGFQISQPSLVTDTATNTQSANGEQRNRGVEISTFGELTDGVRLLGGVMFLDAVLARTANGLNDGWKAAGAPDFRLNLSAEWDTPFVPGLTLRSRVIHTGPQYVNLGTPRRGIPAWTRLDLGARYTFEPYSGKPVTIRMSVENVLNANYWAATFPGSNILIEGAPRTFLLSTTFNF